MNKFREDRKDDRTKIQAGQQSKLIDQRSKDKEPLDFENDFNFEEMMGSNSSGSIYIHRYFRFI
jgi:hypothetical protein